MMHGSWRILFYAVFLIAPISIGPLAFAQNATNSTNFIPPNAIRTTNGGWITPPTLHEEILSLVLLTNILIMEFVETSHSFCFKK